MTPAKFIEKWKSAENLTEREAAQTHFRDLCVLLGVKAPYEDDPSSADYAFEKGASKVGGGKGWADVWKRDCFGWEYKRKGSNLDAALDQLKRYALALDNPPLLIVSDLDRIRIHTNWTATVSKTYEFTLDDLNDADRRDQLKAAFSPKSVGQLKPGETRQALTEEAAKKFAELAQRLRSKGHEAHEVAHFIQRLVFCMFAEDVKLLPNEMFLRTLKAVREGEGDWTELSKSLFKAMKSGGRLGLEKVAHFNGGLFEDAKTLPLEKADVKLLIDVAGKYWGDIDPTIFGTLFERGLDPGKRSQLGAHYTDPDKIMRIVEPVVIRPLRGEWGKIRTQIENDMMRAAEFDAKKTAAAKGEATKAIKRAKDLYRGFLKRLRDFRVLDPACGSGNFLYLSLHALMDLEHRAGIDVEQMGMQRELPGVGPENVKGIEINPFAAELARVTIWIGWLQWMRRNGLMSLPEPILSKLDQIENRDALLNEDGTEAEWPEADAIVGNPPFLGDKKMINVLGEVYVESLRAAYDDLLPGGADLCCYWFEKARRRLSVGTKHAGLVATNSIRGGSNRVVLDQIVEGHRIFEAWGDEPWIVDGAAVRVSIVCFDDRDDGLIRLDGESVDRINSDLTSSAADLTEAAKLTECVSVAFIGDQKTGPFDVPGQLAREWLREPTNPGGRRNAEVLRPWSNGQDITQRTSGRWIIDFGVNRGVGESALFEKPFQHVLAHVKSSRGGLREGRADKLWWLHQRPRPEMRAAVAGFQRFLATPRVAKHRLFVWLASTFLPDCQLVVIARDDETTLGVLHSRMHELWSLGLCTWLGVGNDPRYTPSTTFETFPFPEGLTPNIPAANYANDPRAKTIAAAAKKLNDLREAWLNPEDLVRREPEVVSGYPDRILPINDAAADILKKRTLTNLYNQRPAWLDLAHRDLDAAVAAAYGWKDWGKHGLPDEEILARLFKLNQERAAAGR